MSSAETGFRIHEEMVAGIHDEVRATRTVAEFRATEEPAMQPGAKAFDVAAYENTCRAAQDPAVADSLRLGILVAHRALFRANQELPLPQRIDARLGAIEAGRIGIASLLHNSAALAEKSGVVKSAYADSPGVVLLLDQILTRPPSRIGATLMLGLHIPMVDSSGEIEFHIPQSVPAPSPRPARRSRSAVGYQRQASLRR